MSIAIHHTGITVSDLDYAVSWFCDLFGFTVYAGWETSGPGLEQITGVPGAHLKLKMLKLGDWTLELMQYLAPPGTKLDLTPNNVGAYHVAFTVDDVRRWHRELTAKGVQFMGEPTQSRPSNPTVCYCKGPDGINVELMEISRPLEQR